MNNTNNNNSKAGMLFTIDDNIKCLDTKTDNTFIIRNKKIYFNNNYINKLLDTTKVGMYQGIFRLLTNDDNLLFGINNLNNKIIVNGDNYIKTQLIDDNTIDLYKSYIDIEISEIVKNTKFYVIQEDSNEIYNIDFMYNELCKTQLCNYIKYQTYVNRFLGKEITLPIMSHLSNKILCMNSNVYRNRKLRSQQNLYTSMRLHPERFPIISSVKGLNLTLAQQRSYSNMWYRQFGTSQALPVNDNFGGFNITGSDVPYTN